MFDVLKNIIMQAIILLGGQGTRLRDLYPDRPKALVPVAGRPFIDWQIDWLRRGGVTEVHLAAGFMAEQIEAWAATQGAVTVTREPTPLGTGGALKFIEPHIRSDPFLVVNGDTLLPKLDFQRLGKQHQTSSNDWKITTRNFQRLENEAENVSNDCLPAHDAPGSSLPMTSDIEELSLDRRQAGKTCIAVTRIEQAGRFGTVEFDVDGRVTAFREKADRQAGWINGGVYLMDRRVLDRIPSDTFYSLETDLFPSLIASDLLFAHRTEPPLLDMGTPEGLAEMERILNA